VTNSGIETLSQASPRFLTGSRDFFLGDLWRASPQPTQLYDALTGSRLIDPRAQEGHKVP
jgi:hypothetical protein